jgi:hypothetical protein
MKNKMKQTAVGWLEKELIKRFNRSQMHYTNSEWCFDMIKKLSEQAKEMEKQQIIDAGNDNIFCDAYTIDEEDNYKLTTQGELYYNDKFNN